MKDSKVMLVTIITFLATWLFIGLIAFLLSNATYRECLTHGAMFFFMFCLGWMPAAVVAIDYNKLLNNQK